MVMVTARAPAVGTIWMVCVLSTLSGCGGHAVSSGSAGLEVTVATSGGLIQDAGRTTLWGPAAKKLGMVVREESFENGYQLLRMQSAAGRVSIDAMELPSFLAAKGYRDGLIGSIDYGVVDRTPFATRDAPPYCIGMLSASWVLGWNTKHFRGPQPKTWTDFWDVRHFPGRRAAHVGAEVQLEIALLADGVARDAVYATLSQPGGIGRAIRKWAEIKPYIDVWWTTGSQLAQLMKDGEVDLAIGWNGRFEQLMTQGTPMNYTFQDGVLVRECWAVPAASPNRHAAMQLVNAMTRAEPEARFAAMIKYGPLNVKAFDTGLIPAAVAARLPTNPRNVQQQLAEDDAWWAMNSVRAERAFDEMRSL